MTLNELIRYLETRRDRGDGGKEMAFLDVNDAAGSNELHYFEGGYEDDKTVVLCCKDYT